jgi:virginiamycin B lyase
MSRTVVRAWYAAVVVASFGACALGGCKASEDRGLAIFEVTVAATVPDFQTLRFTSPDHATVPARDLDGPSHRQPFRLGYYVPDPSGGVTVVGTAIRADGCAVGEGTASASGVNAGKQIDGGPLMIAALTKARCTGADAGDGGSGDAGVAPTDGRDGPADTHLEIDGPADTRLDAPDTDASVAPDTALSPDAPGADASMHPDVPGSSDAPGADMVTSVDGPKDGTVVNDAAADAPDVGPPGLGNGEVCFRDSDCTFHHCVDGRCCGVSACSTCQACTGANGTCVQVTKHEDPDTCSGTLACDATGVCVNRITEFPTHVDPFAGEILNIAPGPDGFMWFSVYATDLSKIGKISLDGLTEMEYSVGTSTAGAYGITAGPDGNIWFTEFTAGRIARANTSVTSVAEVVLSTGATPGSVAVGPDGNMWFSASSGSIGRVAPNGTGLMEIKVAGKPASITAGPDGNLWFVEFGAGKVARIMPNGTGLTEIAIPGAISPGSLAAGPDGNLWFIDGGANVVGSVSPSSLQIATLPIPTANSLPQRLAAGPDGNVWFTEQSGNKIARINPGTGAILEIPVPTSGVDPLGIAAGPDGYIWFTEGFGNQIGRLIP